MMPEFRKSFEKSAFISGWANGLSPAAMAVGAGATVYKDPERRKRAQFVATLDKMEKEREAKKKK